MTVFVYDAAGKEIAEYSTTIAPQTQAKVSYLTSDHLGSPRINTDASGAVISRHDYHPFGEEISTQQRLDHTAYAGDRVRKQFTSYERDKETDLDFAHARYFDSGFGRFSSPDPLVEIINASNPQSLNRYVYVLNSPYTATDPLGLYPEWHTDQEIKPKWRKDRDPDIYLVYSSPSTHIDASGKVITVFNDGDNGVYQHQNNADGSAPTAAQITKRHNKKGTSAGGTKIGDTQFWDEFVSPETGRPYTNYRILVGFDFTPYIDALHGASLEMDLRQIGTNSGPGGAFDFKKAVGNVGGLLNGLYVTSRSAGNYLAGYNAASGTYLGVGITFDQFQRLAGAVQVLQRAPTKTEVFNILVRGQTYGPAPNYGELDYQRRMSIEGYYHK